MTPQPQTQPDTLMFNPLRERRSVSESVAIDGFLDWMRDHGSDDGRNCFAAKYWPHDEIVEFFLWYTAEAGIEAISLDRFRVLLTARPGVEASRRRIKDGERYAALRAYLARFSERLPSERYHIYRIASRAEMAASGQAEMKLAA